MLHLFIDTNIFLTFYSLGSDELEELKKLRVAIESGEITLWTTEQLWDELQRNREGYVAKTLDTLQKMNSNQGFPHVVRNMDGFAEMMETRRAYSQKLNDLTDEVKKQYADRCLSADQVLEEIFEAAEYVEVTEEILAAARLRTEVGNPPGKKGSMGDAINWECLLASVPDEEDLYFVSQDGDFSSVVLPDEFKDFLAMEWMDSKSAKIHLHKRIAAFFADHYPKIELASELERQLRVDALVNSASFDETHRAIAALLGETDLTEAQVQELVEAAPRNSQIQWIFNDSDVRGFFQGLVDANGESLDEKVVARFNRYFNPPPELDSPAAPAGP
jgi:predicted nucleic acid-binding protein